MINSSTYTDYINTKIIIIVIIKYKIYYVGLYKTHGLTSKVKKHDYKLNLPIFVFLPCLINSLPVCERKRKEKSKKETRKTRKR